MSDILSNPTPQFGKAEYANAGGPDRCQSCKQPVGSQYYRINGALACANCAEQLKLRQPKDTHQTFVRGLIFGIGGAILGLILYSGFGIITGIEIGYIALAVGWIVGKAIIKGSNGIGGRRYQVAAVLLTYAAVSISAIPIGISMYIKQQNEKKQHLVQHNDTGVPTPSPSSAPSAVTPAATPDVTADAPESSASSEPAPAAHKIGFAAAIGMILLSGLASPFLELADPFHGIIGLVILSVGIRIAWSLTAAPPLEIIGPFATASADSGSASGS